MYTTKPFTVAMCLFTAVFAVETCLTAGAENKPAAARPAVDELIENLRASDPLVRILAAKALGEMKDPGAVDPLIAALSDQDPQVRGNAAVALGKIEDHRALAPLLKLANDTRSYVKLCLFEALASFKDDQASDCLVHALKQFREGAWRFGSNAKDEPSEYQDRESAIEAVITSLGEVGNAQAIPPLRDILRYNELQEGSLAAVALMKLNWKPETKTDELYLLIGTGDDSQIDTRWEEIKQLAITDLNRPLRNEHRDDLKRRALYVLLDSKKPDVVKPLVEALQTNGDMRMAELLLNSWSDELKEAAREWAKKHGYQVL
jgi:HEAT repeat protein